MKELEMTQRTATQTRRPATDAQVKYVRDLLVKRDWENTLPKDVTAFIAGVAPHVGDDDFVAQHVDRGAASWLIDKLLQARPYPSLPGTSTTLAEKVALLKSLPLVKFALTRVDGTGIDFFELVERKDGRRFVNQLLGCPGDWRRERLSLVHQAAAARAFSKNVKAAMDLYAVEFTVCAKCDAPLSDDRSRAARLGPVCAKNLGYDW
jgi:uncharacterized protein DUF6011